MAVCFETALLRFPFCLEASAFCYRVKLAFCYVCSVG